MVDSTQGRHEESKRSRVWWQLTEALTLRALGALCSFLPLPLSLALDHRGLSCQAGGVSGRKDLAHVLLISGNSRRMAAGLGFGTVPSLQDGMWVSAPRTLCEPMSAVHRSTSWRQLCPTPDSGLLTLQWFSKPAVLQRRLSPSLPSPHLHYVTPTEILSQILP